MSGETNMECSEAEPGLHEFCCLHEIIYGEHSGDEVCCWCGDIYSVVYETKQHGPCMGNTRLSPTKPKRYKK